MKCPNCPGSELRTVLTKQGVEIDRCERCEGVWLDRGEIFLFATPAKSIAGSLEQALATQRPTQKLSPASGKPMSAIVYPGGPRLDYCPATGGLWFDAGELAALLGAEPGIHLDIDQATTAPRSSPPGADQGTADGDAGRHAAIAAGMLALPNLLLRSTATLVGLTPCSAPESSPWSSSWAPI